jgi:DNA repair exonuclease SbcCD ATPase subunit
MMSESVFFEWLEIERFRGFADSQRLDLEASVLILWGPNGTGKTSFFDAIQWLLVGSLDRLESWRVRRNSEHIVNRYSHASGDAACVAAGIRVGDAQVELRRSGRYDASQLEWRDQSRVLYEDDADSALAECLTPMGRMSLKRSLLSSGLLQQDVIRDVLEDKPAHRYDQLAAILGLDSIADFPLAAKKRAERLAAEGNSARERYQNDEARVRIVEDRIGTLQSRAAKSPDLAEQRRKFAERVERHSDAIKLRAAVPSDPTNAMMLRIAAGTLADQLELLEVEAEELRQSEPKDVPPSALKELEESVETSMATEQDAREDAQQAEQQYRDEQALADRMSRLAREALPLLGEECPVCEQEIVKGEVHQHLEGLIEGGSSSIRELEMVRDRSRESLGKAEEAAQSTRAELEAAELRAKEALRTRQRRDKWRERIREFIKQQEEWLLLPMEPEITNGDKSAISAARWACEEVARASADLHAALSWSPEMGPIASAREEITELRDGITDARAAAVEASTAEEDGKVLQRAAVRAVAAITKERFDVLRPVLQDIYSRLDPHPTFSRLQFAVDVYREKGIASPEVVDTQEGVGADPLLVFSSSQANVVALSAFLALGWAAGRDAMPFLLLDDPLQSLDDVNALGFADLCRHMRSGRQLIVSTHDERLANLLMRKLAPRRENHRSRVLKFVAWNRSGPIIEQRELDPQLDQGNRLVGVSS